MTRVIVIRTGIANMASVLVGLERAGGAPEITVSPSAIANADRIVLPGVGAFGAAIHALTSAGLVDPIAEHVRRERPLLAICLGLQLLCSESEESPGVRGLSIIPDAVRRFPGTVRVPQLGWNRVIPDAKSQLIQDGYAYFANSYRLERVPPGFVGTTCTHDAEFVAALERGPLLACQFHPELSGAWGQALLTRWLAC